MVVVRTVLTVNMTCAMLVKRINGTFELITSVIPQLFSGTFHQRQAELSKMQWSIGCV